MRVTLSPLTSITTALSIVAIFLLRQAQKALPMYYSSQAYYRIKQGSKNEKNYNCIYFNISLYRHWNGLYTLL